MKQFHWFRALDDGHKPEPYCPLFLSDVKMAAFIHCFVKFSVKKRQAKDKISDFLFKKNITKSITYNAK